MTAAGIKRTGGQLIVEALKANGVSRVSCVPGESYLAVLDALYESGIETVVCRQEGGAAMMADTWGRLTGEPGICMVTRGPGATNASAGLHIARQDSIPMILFIGQVQKWNIAAPSPNSPNGWARSTMRAASPNSSPAPSPSPPPAAPARWC
jgi:acetolactate synthase I/II/III large subunit